MKPEPIETAAAPGGPMHDGREVLIYGRTAWDGNFDHGYPPSWRVATWDATRHWDSDRNDYVGAWIAVSSNPYRDHVEATLWCDLPPAEAITPPAEAMGWPCFAKRPGSDGPWREHGAVEAEQSGIERARRHAAQNNLRLQVRTLDGAVMFDSAHPGEAIGAPQARQLKD